MRTCVTVLFCAVSAAALLAITGCKELFADIEEDFSYWASEPTITGFRAASPAQTSPAGVQCVPSASDAVITLTVRNPKNFSFIMPNDPGAPADIVMFGDDKVKGSGGAKPIYGTDYTLAPTSDGKALRLTYMAAFLKANERSSANIGASIKLYSTDGRKFNQIYSFNLEANTPPPDPAPVFASDDNHIALFKTRTPDSQGKRYYVLCFKVAGFTESGATDLHSDLTHVYVSKNGGDETPCPVTLTTADFDITHSGGTFIAKTDVDKLSNAEAEASPGSGSPLPGNVPSGPWVLYFKTDVPVGGATAKYRIRLFDGKLYSDYAQKSTSTRELSVPKVFAHTDIDNVAAFGVYTEATKIVTPSTIATVDGNDLNGGGTPIGGVAPDGSDETHAIPVYSAYGSAVKLTIKKPDGTDYPAGVTVTGSAEKHSGDSASGTASFTAGQSAVVTLPSPTDGGGEVVYKVVFKATGEGFDDSAERTLYYKVRREIKAVNNLPMWYMLGAAIEKIPLGGAGTVKISGTVKAQNISYPPLPGTPPVPVVNDSTIDVSGERDSGDYPGRTVTLIGDNKASSILDANNLCSVFTIEYNGKLILKNVTLQNAKNNVGGYGGGINIGDNGSSLVMTDTDIKDCTVTAGARLGGAVYIRESGSLTVGSGCVISGNTASGGNGDGIYVQSGGTFNIAGDAKIDENNDVYLKKNEDFPSDSSKNAKITVTAPLTGTDTVAKITPQDYTVGVTAVNAASGVSLSGYSERFKITGQTIISPPSTVLWKLRYNSNNTLVLKANVPITVDGTDPNAWKTLKEAIEAAIVEDGDEFIIRGTIKATNASGNSGEITVTKKITVRGDGTNPELDANSNHTGAPPADAPATPHRIFTVEDGGELTLENLTLKGGNAGSDYGGAILIKTGSAGDIRNTRIYGCKALNGGAICNEGSLRLSLCHIGASGKPNEATSSGGAIYSNTADSALCTILGTDISYNKAAQLGGGICIMKGECTIGPENAIPTSIWLNGSTSMGGGLHIGTLGVCKISDMTKITTNSSVSGGGICSFGTLEIKGSSGVKVDILDNSGTWGGGIYQMLGTLTTEHTEIKRNTAVTAGGGIYVAGGSCTLKDGTILGGGSDDNFVTDAGSNGGGVYVAGTFVMAEDAIVVPSTLTDAGKNDVYLMPDKYITLKNSLTGTAPVASITPSRYIAGRAVVKGDGYALTVSDTNRFTVTPKKDGSKTLYWEVDKQGKLVRVVDGTKPKAWKALKDAVSDAQAGETVTIKGEIKATKEGAAGDDANWDEIEITKDLTIKKAEDASSAVINANKIVGGKQEHRIFHVKSGTLTLENLTLQGGRRTSGPSGGGMYIQPGAVASLTDCRIIDCVSSLGNGGAVYTQGTLRLTRGSIGGTGSQEGNQAKYGGGIYVEHNGSCTITETKILENYADGGTSSSSEGKGGGIYVAQGGTCSLYDVDTMKNNTVKDGSPNKGKGAGIYVESGGICNIAGSTKIDEGNEFQTHDVYLAKHASDQSKNAKLTVTAPLTGTHTVAKITPEDYTAGVTAVNAALGVSLSGYADRFKITKQTIISPPSTVPWKLRYNSNNTLVLKSATTVIPSTATWKTLKNAIEASTLEDGDEFVIQSTITAIAMTDHHGAISVTKKITVKGEGASSILDANSSGSNHPLTPHRIFTVEDGGELTLEDITLTGGKAAGTTDDKKCGGAIFVKAGCKAKLTNCIIKNCVADKFGGGICSEGELTLDGGTIGGSAADGNKAMQGGGICIQKNGRFTLKTATISENKADYGGAVVVRQTGSVSMESGFLTTNTVDYLGGGVHVDNSASFTMTGGKIKTNNANGGGGGVYVHSGTFTLSGSASIESNTAAGKNGGGIYVDSTGKLEIKGGSIKSNKATKTSGGTGMGGGVYVYGDYTHKGKLDMSGGSIEGNGAGENSGSYEGSGGGVYINGGTFTTTGGEIKTNNAKNGGGVYAEGGAGITLTNTKINSCVAALNGGAIFVSGSTVNITNCTLTGNTATDSSGAGGAIFAQKDGSTPSTVTISGGTIGGTGTDANKVTGSWGFGGGIYINDDCSLTLNEYTDGGGKHGVRIIGNEAARGGGVRANNSTVTMTGCTVSGNTATDSTNLGGGGGVYTHRGTLTMTRCTFTDNTANNNGGGMIIEGGTADMTNCTLTGNQAKNGGAIFVQKDDTAAASITIMGGTIGGTGTNSNKATGTGANEGNGGGIYVGGNCTVTLKNNDQNEGCIVKGNTANSGFGGGFGGGVYVDMNSRFTMHGGTIKNNTSNVGKGVYVAASSGGMGNQDGYFIMGGKACVGDWGSDGTLKDGNDVYLKENDDSGAPASIKIDSGNPITESKVACITPESYGLDVTVVRMTDGSSVGAYTNKFTVTPKGTQTWSVDSDGTLKTP
ncbi:right-handed parallel beta-helix repeat-containing protein [Treponema sp. Marseille-Q4130]|uniref:right-handed parallel beta-helix repeat-containing protein n=1 Tax=Treponema sp. Marseille-Q4130 TaxID=2766702 RepID=UPI0016525D5A|nr:right-handed parallel beta-helix repeat-containing protein [Treponema sp. Marseille-Q4130]MBC6718954.1 hypothetical protein [Treponema sp. Marseille-Q4130]